MRGWLCAGRFRVLTLRRIVRAVGGLGIVSDLGFYGSQPSRTFSEKRPYLFVTFAFFAVEIRFILQAGTMKPRLGRQADPAAKRCRATRSPEGERV
jgi:hypothetical protein